MITLRYKDNPYNAIRYLLKKQIGVCKMAMYRKGIGYIDFAWGDPTGGLQHIVMKHAKYIEDLPSFIVLTIKYGTYRSIIIRGKERYEIDYGDNRVVIDKGKQFGAENFVLTAFDKNEKKLRREYNRNHKKKGKKVSKKPTF